MQDGSDILLNSKSNATPTPICLLNDCAQVEESLESLNSPQIHIKKVLGLFFGAACVEFKYILNP
jgi:hypothetical protein